MMEIENIPISEIIPYEKNPRKNEKAVEIVAKSIKEFGFKVPIILDKNNIIIAGHTRLKAANKLGITKVPIIRADDLNEEQVKAFRLMDNKSTEYSDWETDLLKGELSDLKLENFNLDLTGFPARELNELLKLGRDEAFDIEKETQKTVEKGTKIKKGDLWQLGNHKLIIGDCTILENWKRLLGCETFDFMFTDPPYKLAYTERTRKIVTPKGEIKKFKDKSYDCVGKTNKHGKSIISKGRFKEYTKTKKGFGFRGQRHYLGVDEKGGVPEFDEWLKIANQYQNKKGANILIFENWKNTPELWTSMAKYWKIKNMVIWWLPNRCQGFGREYFLFNKYDIAILGDSNDKGVYEASEEAYLDFLEKKGQKLVDSYEIALYGQKGKSSFNRKKRKATAKVSDHITWTSDTEKASGQNLVFGTKPLPILIPYIKVLSDPGEIVCDPFGGSGSTLIACEIMTRKCRMIELSPIYAEVIIKRWEKFTGKKAIKI